MVPWRGLPSNSSLSQCPWEGRPGVTRAGRVSHPKSPTCHLEGLCGGGPPWVLWGRGKWELFLGDWRPREARMCSPTGRQVLRKCLQRKRMEGRDRSPQGERDCRAGCGGRGQRISCHCTFLIFCKSINVSTLSKLNSPIIYTNRNKQTASSASQRPLKEGDFGTGGVPRAPP